ncbi:M3 family peptidase [Rubrivivax sp. A210]|uniref:M3 family metallopeptidase n=1 Tax=Rubrivivax sp. A210 TaxID=2772301 RepID=UPI001919D5DF|nr:M3 family metallopeptidase [Rubrivivax sp. A210]CAD5374872.1 M3 family peptidase [Rubrivivax sp. A210]
MPGNPLLQDWTAPHGLPPYAALRAEHFEAALQEAMRRHRDELAAIANQAAPAGFANTVAAFDRGGALLERVAAVFYNLTASATSPELQAVQRAMAGPMAAHHSAVYNDMALFARIADLHARRDALGLDAEAQRMLDRVYLDFVRAGARLAPAARERMAQLMEELARLMTRFAQNVLQAESAWTLALAAEADLAGLPDFVRASARQAAADRGLAGHVVTLSRSLIVPFLSYSTRRDLREQAWRAWTSRGEHAGAQDNREIARDILRLRREQAALHGHACYADYALEDTMAGTRGAVQQLLDEVWPRALAAVAREEQALREQMRAEGEGATSIEPWDWRFWAEKVRRERYALDDAEVKPYFPLERVVEAAFDCAGRLFGLSFAHRADLPVYHPDVKAYEVSENGRLIGVFLQDNYARPNKRSGAWMSALRWQHRNPAQAGAAGQLPVILNNNNFAKGGPEAPTLLSLDDARTLFHEFGHGLHGLLSNVTYGRLSGTQVLRDFVELPSQLFEHWITEPEVLRRHARHCHTGEPIPDELIARLQRARQFNQGYETVRYCASAIVDLAVHALPDAEPPADLCAFESELLREQGLPPGVGLNHRLVHFQHLFSSAGYAAGYYVYLWAEVLDADGYDAFVEAGSPFDAATAARLRRHVYGAGNSAEPRAAYAAFRGRAATVQPLLRKRGLLAEPA